MRQLSAVLLCWFALVAMPAFAGGTVDTVLFADLESSKAHGLEGKGHKIVPGALGGAALTLQPPAEEHWRGGRIRFDMKVDPDQPNYFTAKFWGSDVTGEDGRLMLFIDGKQVGQRHLGEVDMLDIMNKHPRNPGKFFYKTLPLPESMTRGKKTVAFAIEAQGHIWGYGNTIERFQKPMVYPSRGLYRAYTHTQPCFVPSGDEPQGEPTIDYPTSTSGPGVEVLDEVKKKVNDRIAKELKGKDGMHPDGALFLAMAYLEPWTLAYNDPAVLEKIARVIDHYYKEFKKEADYKPWHPWIGAGPLGGTVSLLGPALEPLYDTKVVGLTLSRRRAWSELFEASRGWHVQNRRSYTNQSMIVDLNIYRCNRGLRLLNPSKAWSEKVAMRLMHESAGLKPWSGSWDEDLKPSWRDGKKFMLLTEMGLTKELGYVGHYGDIVFELILMMYDATRPAPGVAGDDLLKEQFIKACHARGPFRFPLPDDDGARAMQMQTVIGWRDWKYPGGLTYDQFPARDSGPLDVAAATLDPVLLGWGQQMIEDNQLFGSLRHRAKGNGFNVMMAILVAPRSYETVLNAPTSPHRLPMTPGQPDFVFADPENAVVALKNGDDIFYVSLYWRARYAINNLARVHYLTPLMERDATVNIETHFRDSGLVYTVQDRTNEPFNGRHEKFYKQAGMQLATAGQKQPIAKVPSSQSEYKPGKENIFAGKGSFYLMEYGPYLVAMNCQAAGSKSFTLPERFGGAVDVVTGQALDASTSRMTLEPLQTVVLYLGS